MSNIQKLFVDIDRVQCYQIGPSLKNVGDKFNYKKYPKYMGNFRAILKTLILSEKLLRLLVGYLLKKFGQLFISGYGHTDRVQCGQSIFSFSPFGTTHTSDQSFFAQNYFLRQNLLTQPCAAKWHAFHHTLLGPYPAFGTPLLMQK